MAKNRQTNLIACWEMLNVSFIKNKYGDEGVTRHYLITKYFSQIVAFAPCHPNYLTLQTFDVLKIFVNFIES